MSLDIDLKAYRLTNVYEGNITHNCGDMAAAVGIYDYIWHPDQLPGITKAGDILKPLLDGLRRLKENPEYYRQFEAENGWGTYDQFVSWLKEYIAALWDNPDAEIRVSR